MAPRDSVIEIASRPGGERKIVIEGRHWAEALWKMGMLVPCVFISFCFWHSASVYDAGTDDALQLKCVAVIVFLNALYLPWNAHTYLDLTLRQVVSVRHYAGFKVWERDRPFSDYDGIVVRHCYSGGSEGPDVYTGDVGLRPANRGPVLWVKSFEANPDEIPVAAYEFARELHRATRLELL